MHVTLDDWDPLPSERTYYRSTSSGDLGYLVRRGGEDKIRLDRPMEEIIRPLRENEWQREQEFRPFARAQVAAIAFETDKLLCKMLGLHKEGKAEWLSLKDDDRIAFMQDGPAGGNPLRRDLYLAIRGILDPYSR